MHIAIITFHNPINYGAVLQCYALCKVLQGMGHTVEVIDYHRIPPPPQKFKSISWGNLPRSIYHRAKLILQKPQKNAIRQVFKSFVGQELPLSRGRYVGAESLRDNPPIADAYICGSDQIWNDRFWSGFDEAYFLRFGGQDVRRVAYAPGVPGTEFRNGTPAQFGRLISGFSLISAREEIGRKLIKTVTGLDVPIVADPTILYGAFEDVVQPVNETPKRYILTYLLPVKNESDGETESIIKTLRNTLAVSVVPVSLSGKGPVYSPFEWLWLIRYSECFVTNSYHGLIFALLFKREFFVLPRDGNPEGQDARMLYLLDKFGLADRYVKSALEVGSVNRIDWERVSGLIEKERLFSWRFLKDALA